MCISVANSEGCQRVIGFQWRGKMKKKIQETLESFGSLGKALEEKASLAAKASKKVSRLNV